MDLTPSAFLAFYPQFSSFSQGVVLTEYLRQANARFSDFGSDADEARRLYTAHKLTLYARVALPDGTAPGKAAIAAAGEKQQQISGKKVGEVSVTYSSGSSSSVSTGFADLTETDFGMQLLSLLRLYSRSVYVP